MSLPDEPAQPSDPSSAPQGGAQPSGQPAGPSVPNVGPAPTYAPYPAPMSYPAPAPGYSSPYQPAPGYPAPYPPAPGYYAPYPSAPGYPAPYAPPPYPAFYPSIAVPSGMGPGARRRPGYIVAGIGALIAIIAYFALPLYVITISLSESSLDINYSTSQSISASQVAGVTLPSSFSLTSLFFLIPVVTIVALVVSVVVPLSTLIAKRGVHIAATIFFQIGAVAAGALFIVGSLQFVDQYKQSVSGLLGTSSSALGGFGYTFDLSFGFYVLLAGIALLLIGGVLVLARGDRAMMVAAPVPVGATVPPSAV